MVRHFDEILSLKASKAYLLELSFKVETEIQSRHTLIQNEISELSSDLVQQDNKFIAFTKTIEVLVKDAV
jgi:hypothetical protein